MHSEIKEPINPTETYLPLWLHSIFSEMLERKISCRLNLKFKNGSLQEQDVQILIHANRVFDGVQRSQTPPTHKIPIPVWLVRTLKSLYNRQMSGMLELVYIDGVIFDGNVKFLTHINNVLTGVMNKG